MFSKNTHIQGSIMRRLILQATALTGLTIVVLACLSLLIAHSLVRVSTVTEIGTLSSIAEESVEKSLQSARERTVLLSDHQAIQTMIRRRTDTDAARAGELVIGEAASLPVLSLTLQNGAGEPVVHIGQGKPVTIPASASTLLFPSVTASGVTVYEVHTPVRNADGIAMGMLAVRYDASSVMIKLASLSLALGDTGEAMLSFPKNGEPFVFRPSTDARRFSLLPLAEGAETPTLLSLKGKEGIAETADDEGEDVFAAYRYLPDIGWGFVMTVERSEVFADITSLSRLIALIGFFLLLLAAVVAVMLSRTITQPLRSLADKVQNLRPDHWDIHRTVTTKDEVEVLDTIVVDMATRLKKVYDSLEDVIKERTHELAERYALDRTILESIAYAVIAVDADGKITDANPAAALLLGIPEGQMKGKRAEDAVQFRAHQGNALPNMHPVLQCLSAKGAVHSPVSAHWNIQKADGSLVPVSCSINPLMEKGNQFGAIVVLQDVSEERRLDYLKSEFITLASHQLRTPLSALRWYVELMGEGEDALSEDQKGYVKEMGVSLKRMANLLDSLLRASQMEEGGLGISLEDVNVNQLLSETDEDFRSIAAEQNIGFSVSLPEAPVSAHTDPTLLRIVLQNLLSNAVKYTHKDAHVLLELSQREDDFTITVTDEGLGIPVAEQKRVFQKFFRAHNVRQMDTDGNGLGLYITKSIVERLGGAIRFTSEEGKGTTFTVTFPMKVSEKHI